MGEQLPSNLSGGQILMVDAANPRCSPLPSIALCDTAEHDPTYLRPGIYEDKIFAAGRPFRLIGAGRDHVQIFCRRGGPLSLRRVSGGQNS
jgi:hypothetical protein